MVFLIPAGFAYAETVHQVYLKGTDSQLDVYFIKGRLPGPTLMIVGGIQGDEPGGYLAADLYADIALKRGNMIVVPRANFSSIVSDARGLQGDMNRKFAGRVADPDRDAKVVEILKDLMKQSDFFLNLHDGSGYYHPVWESPLRNPMRYGQSIIADAESHTRGDGKVIDLGNAARRVIERVNAQIEDVGHLFRFNNHDTLAENTRHKEQRLSATFYALTQIGIPAFGIETSKDIPDYRVRVRYQTMVVNAFLEEFGIVLENPKLCLDNPALRYLIVSVNGATPIVVSGQDVLKVQKGDRIRIVHIDSNYSRGLTAQIKGTKSLVNYLDREIVVNSDMVIQVRKDRFLIAQIPVELIPESRRHETVGVHFEPRVEYFCVRVNDTTYAVKPDEEITVTRGDTLVVTDPKTTLSKSDEKAMRIDLRGFQSESSGYPIEDRGHVIDTDKNLQPKYGHARGDAVVYPLQAKLHKKILGQCRIAVTNPRLDYLVLRGANGAGFIVQPGDMLEVPSEEVIRIMDIRTNLPESAPLFITMSGSTIRWKRNGSAGIDASKLPERETPLDVTRNGRSFGRIWVKQGNELRVTSASGRERAAVVPVRYQDSRAQ
ncbi:MAG: M14/M99 family metallopeptidase [Desulfomonile sp.]|nr:M14/M99 family metallopeptidase [Desulfomonile sp.]